jgi:hypothetical protein
LCPLRGHTQSFHNSGRGCTMVPLACERRSLLIRTGHGGPSRREIRSESHTRPGQDGATNSRLTSSRRTLAGTPGSRAIGGKTYRRSLGQVCTMASSPYGPGETKKEPKGSESASPTLGEASHPRAAPLRCPGVCTALCNRSCPGTTQGSGVPASTKGRDRRPPWWLM